MSDGRKPFIGLAALLAGSYLILSVLSLACSVEHLQSQTSAHHHGGTLSHSGFCAWACQVNPTSDAGPSALVLHPLSMVALFVETSHTILTGGTGYRAASRAPPVQS